MRSVWFRTAVASVLWVGGLGTLAAQNRNLSPRDTTRATIAGATLMVDYGRPSKRGRAIFGSVVPYDRVWRTGANQATHLVSDKPLVFGQLTVPAGAHTLWTVPGRNGWKLVINKQTAQWGTDYDESKDLGRVDMKVQPLSSIVERLTIRLVPVGRGGELRIEWDGMAAVAEFEVKG